MFIRKLISKDKIQYQDCNLNLDLMQLTDRIIVMGLPGETNGLWRNDIDDFATFFEEMYDTHFKIINLSGHHYDYSKFHSRVVEFPVPDHDTPSLELLLKVLGVIEKYLKEDPTNVVAVHCTSKASRTAVVVASHLLYMRAFNEPAKALEFFAEKRSSSTPFHPVPSQLRYLGYFDKILNGYPYQAGRRLVLKQICISPVPAVELNEASIDYCCTPAINIYSRGKLVYSSLEKRGDTFYQAKHSDINLEVGITVCDDVQIEFYHKVKSKAKYNDLVGPDSDLSATPRRVSSGALSPNGLGVVGFPYVLLFRFSLNTSFVARSTPCTDSSLSRKELDIALIEGKTARPISEILPEKLVTSTLFVDLVAVDSENIPYHPESRVAQLSLSSSSFRETVC